MPATKKPQNNSSNEQKQKLCTRCTCSFHFCRYISLLSSSWQRRELGSSLATTTGTAKRTSSKNINSRYCNHFETIPSLLIWQRCSSPSGIKPSWARLMPRPHVSGDFCIRKFFCADTKISASTRSVYESYTTVHTYPIRIRTSQRISQQSMRKKTGSDTVTSAYTKIYGYERPHVSGYTAYTEISTLESVYRNLRIHRAYTADTCGR